MKRAIAKFDPSSTSPKVTSLVDHLENRNARRTGWLFNSAPATSASSATVPVPTPITPIRDEVAEARLAAEEEGIRSAQARVEMVVQRYADGIRRLGDVVQRSKRPDAGELVGLAMVVAQQIIGHELSIDAEAIVQTVEAALATVADDPSVRVRIGSVDLAYIKRRRADLLESNMQFVEDPTLSVGGCIVETALRVVDASMERRMDAIRQGLEEMMVSAPEIRDEEGEAEELPEVEEIVEQEGRSAC